MEDRKVKLFATRNSNLGLYMIPGHFSTCNSHINAYIDMNSLKTRIAEAREVAENLAADYVKTSDVIDTIVCLDGTEVVGAFLAEQFETLGFFNNNKHNTIYVVTPEHNMNNQMLFRDNNVNAIRGRHVLLLMSTTTTGQTIRRSMEGVRYYGGIIQGVSSIFSTIREVDGMKVNSVFTEEDIPGYTAYPANECPFCQKGMKLEAMVNSYGYSKFTF